MEAVAIGDLHLTSIAGNGALSKYTTQPNEMVLAECQKVVDWARKRHIHNVFQLGDVCDGPRMSYEAMLALINFLKANDDMMFYFILGNHDLFGETTATGHSLEVLKLLALPNVVFHTKPRTLTIDGARVRFLPFPHEDFDTQALNVYHKEVRGALNDQKKPFKDEALPSSQAVIVAGHLHTAHRIRNTFFCGTLYQTNFGEKLPKYFQHIRFNNVKDYDIELIPHTPKYTLHKVILETRADLEKIPTGEHQLVKLIIQDGCDVHPADTNYPNIVDIKNFKTRDDLKKILVEDLTNAQALKIRTQDFFDAWLDNLDVEEADRDGVRNVRDRILKAARMPA